MTVQTMPRTEKNREEIAETCRQLGVIRLDLFGSAARDDFDAQSDIDVVVRFDRARGEIFRRYFDLKERLEAIWERTVDVVVEDAIKNPYFQKAVDETRFVLYEA